MIFLVIAWGRVKLRKARVGYVYFIENELGQVKVGMTRKLPGARLSAFQTGSAQQLRLLYAFPSTDPRRLERQLHQTLQVAGAHIRGEWFRGEEAKGLMYVLMQREGSI